MFQGHLVSFVVVGAFTGVIHGNGDLTECTASPPRCARRISPGSRLKLAPEPAGSVGYDDLRRHASREPLGRGLRPQVASPGDLARMVGALESKEENPARSASAA